MYTSATQVKLNTYSTAGPKKFLLPFRSWGLLPAVRVIHPDPSAFVVLAIQCTDHLRRRFAVYLYPAIHFFHINSAEYIFGKLTHVENKL